MSKLYRQLAESLDKTRDVTEAWQAGRETGYLIGLHNALRVIGSSSDCNAAICKIELLISDVVAEKEGRGR